MPNSSTCTEWSMTNSAGCNGLMSFGSPPRRFMASRMAARSTTAGTPEILQQHAAGRECNFFFRLRIPVPCRECANLFLRHIAPVFGAQQILQQNAQRKRQVLGGDALLVESVNPVELVFLVADFESSARAKSIRGHDGQSFRNAREF